MKKSLFLLIFCTTLFNMYGQQNKVKILNADNTYHNEEEFPGAILSLGNVFLEHKGATLRCQKAYIYQTENLVKAIGEVYFNQGDTITQTSKYLEYNGDTQKVISWGNVVLKDPQMTLTTDTLYFDRTKQELFYKSGGTIKDSINTLNSIRGTYYLETNQFVARTKVDVVNEDSHLISNHLNYYTDSGISELFGPSTITSETNRIYTEKGFHNSQTNISHFVKNSKIEYNDRIIEGDSLYYDKNLDFASATGNIKITDTINKSIIRGGYAELYKAQDSVYIIDRAEAISYAEKDSLHIHGDRILVTGKPENRIIRAYYHVKFFKSDMQGKCDSLYSNQVTGVTKLIKNPVLWAQMNQITGDTIHLISNVETEQLDSLKILNHAFMIQKDSAGYSQLKGKNMYGKFDNNKLISLDVQGNSEVIYFGRNESQELFGITKMKSSSIFVEMKENEIQTINFIKDADGKTYPPSRIHENDRILRGFIWREEEKPLSKEDIFKHD